MIAVFTGPLPKRARATYSASAQSGHVYHGNIESRTGLTLSRRRAAEWYPFEPRLKPQLNRMQRKRPDQTHGDAASAAIVKAMA